MDRSKPGIDVKELKRSIYKKSYFRFFQDAFQALHHGKKPDVNWHHSYLCNELQQEAERVFGGAPRTHDLLLCTPPRASKSLLVSVCFPLWCWLNWPTAKFICVSANQQLANQLALQGRDLINSPWFQEYFGDKVTLRKDVDAKSNYQTVQGGTRLAFGRGANVTGFGADIILVDDINSANERTKPVAIQEASSYYDGALSSRLDNALVGGRIILQQRIAENDLIGHLLARDAKASQDAAPAVKLISIPAELTGNTVVSPVELRDYYDNDGLFWPSLFPRRRLDQHRAELGSRDYASQYLQRPVPEGGNLFREEEFAIIDSTAFAAETAGAVWHAWLDTAYTADAKNDASALLIGTVYNGYLYVAEVHELRLEFPQLLQKLPLLLEKYLTTRSKLYVEGKASGKSVVQQLRASSRFNIIEVSPGRDSKYTRAVAASPFVEGRRVKLQAARWNRDFLDQLTSFPNAAHDDMVDVLLYAVATAQKPVASFSSFVIGR